MSTSLVCSWRVHWFASKKSMFSGIIFCTCTDFRFPNDQACRNFLFADNDIYYRKYQGLFQHTWYKSQIKATRQCLSQIGRILQDLILFKWSQMTPLIKLMPVSVKSKVNIKWIISIHMPLAFLGIDFNFQRLEIASSPWWGLVIFTRYHGSRFSLFFLIFHSVFVCRKESNSTTNLWIWGIWYMGLVLFVIYQ